MGKPDRAGREPTHDECYAVYEVAIEVFEEVVKAMEMHAPMHGPHEGHSVLREEVEELWEHVKADTGRTPEARKEAIQVAAMAVRYIVDLIDKEKTDE